VIKNVYWFQVKYPLFFSDFNEVSTFRTDFGKILIYRILEESVRGSRVVPCGRTDRQTDMKKPIVSFRNFAEAPKKYQINLLQVSFVKLNDCFPRRSSKFIIFNKMSYLTTGVIQH